MPSEDEVKALLAYAGPVEELSPPERFMLLMCGVPRSIAKVGALMFRLQFRTLCGDAEEGMAAIRAAAEQLRASPRLCQVSAW
jgi:Formin Homology 2 Domain